MTSYEKKRRICERVARHEKPVANAKRIAKNTLVLYFRMLVVMFVALFTSRVMLQTLGVSDYGLYSVAMSVVAMFVFVNGSLSGASSRFLVVELGKGTIGSLKRTFSTIFIVHLVLAFIFVLILETIGLMFLETKLNIDPSRISAVKWAYQCGVAVTFLNITQVPYSAIITAHERMSAFAWMSLYDVFAKLAIVYLLMVSPFDRLKVYATLLALSSATTIAIYRIYCIRNFTEARFRRVFDAHLLKPIFSFAGWHVATQVIIMLSSQGLVMLNQRYFGPALVAAIGIASTVKGHIRSFIDNFKTAANPQIIKLYACGKMEESKRLLTETVLFSVFLLLILGVPIWFYSTEALRIWLGDAMPPYSPVFVKIIMVGMFFSIFDSSLYAILYATGRIKENMYFNVVIGLGAFCSAFALIHFTRNPLVSCIVSACHLMLLGVVAKPILLHVVAGYSFQDFRRMFVPSFLALVCCSSVAFMIKVVMPTALVWAVPSCLLIVVANCVVIYFLLASDALRGQFSKLLLRVPYVGSGVDSLFERFSAPVKPIRDFLQGLAG